MNLRPLLLPGLLTAAVLASALGVAYSRYLTRTEFARLQNLDREADRLEIEWNRLRLEESALAAYARVERLARRHLHMRRPRPDEIRYLEARP